MHRSRLPGLGGDRSLRRLLPPKRGMAERSPIFCWDDFLLKKCAFQFLQEFVARNCRGFPPLTSGEVFLRMHFRFFYIKNALWVSAAKIILQAVRKMPFFSKSAPNAKTDAIKHELPKNGPEVNLVTFLFFVIF